MPYAKPMRFWKASTALVSGSDMGPLPRKVSSAGSGDEPSLSWPHL